MAEVFVVVAGYVAGIRFSKDASYRGVWRGVLSALWRAFEIYCAWIITLVAMPVVHEGALRCAAAGDRDLHYYEAFWQCPASWLQDVCIVTVNAGQLSILALYLSLVPAAPFLAVAAVRSRNVVICGSVLMYCVSQCVSQEILIPSFWRNAWYFNPFAWQLLYCGGVVIGAIRPVCSGPPRLRSVAVPAFLVLEAAFLLKVSVDEAALPWVGKSNLELLRVVHFAALALLAWPIVDCLSKSIPRVLLRPIVICGRNSLIVFCFSVVLSDVLATVMDWRNLGVASQISLNVCGYCVLTGVATAWECLKGQIGVGRRWKVKESVGSGL